MNDKTTVCFGDLVHPWEIEFDGEMSIAGLIALWCAGWWHIPADELRPGTFLTPQQIQDVRTIADGLVGYCQKVTNRCISAQATPRHDD